ncbi:MAG: LrgB family protein [Oscillospiraceae bacterium]|nr:LrgB family protein [Oscillospiraceae bacterium]
MVDFLSSLSLFPLALTFSAFGIGLWCQKKTRFPLCNPILIGAALVIGVLMLLDYSPELYQEGTDSLSWFLTPATICLAVPLYQQLKILKKNLPAILTGVLAGSVAGLVVVFLLCKLFALDRQFTVTLLPKSITASIAMVLSEENGGIESLSGVVILITGILGNLLGSTLCKLLKLTDPISQGVALGTSAHLVGTSKATELSPLAGAVSTLALVVAGVFVSLIFPVICQLL